MHPEMARVLVEMRIEDFQHEAAAYHRERRAVRARRAARGSKAKRPGWEARRRAALAPGKGGSCVGC